jgi:DNA-binding transcriptional ArsR family regulator
MWDEKYRALADPQRRVILKRLRAGPLPAGELAAGLEIGASTLSHHLKLLKEADLLRCEKRGTQRIYALNTSVLEDLATDLLELRGTGE